MQFNLDWLLAVSVFVCSVNYCTGYVEINYGREPARSKGDFPLGSISFREQDKGNPLYFTLSDLPWTCTDRYMEMRPAMGKTSNKNGLIYRNRLKLKNEHYFWGNITPDKDGKCDVYSVRDLEKPVKQFCDGAYPLVCSRRGDRPLFGSFLYYPQVKSYTFTYEPAKKKGRSYYEADKFCIDKGDKTVVENHNKSLSFFPDAAFDHVLKYNMQYNGWTREPNPVEGEELGSQTAKGFKECFWGDFTGELTSSDVPGTYDKPDCPAFCYVAEQTQILTESLPCETKLSTLCSFEIIRYHKTINGHDIIIINDYIDYETAIQICKPQRDGENTFFLPNYMVSGDAKDTMEYFYSGVVDRIIEYFGFDEFGVWYAMNDNRKSCPTYKKGDASSWQPPSPPKPTPAPCSAPPPPCSTDEHQMDEAVKKILKNMVDKPGNVVAEPPPKRSKRSVQPAEAPVGPIENCGAKKLPLICIPNMFQFK